MRSWPSTVLQAAESWCSVTDIEAGKLWVSEVQRDLQEARFAIVCTTKEIVSPEWLDYGPETIVERLKGNVMPWLLGISVDEFVRSPSGNGLSHWPG